MIPATLLPYLTPRAGVESIAGNRIDSKFRVVLNTALFILSEFAMSSRYVLSALAGVFLAVVFVAVATTVKHLSHNQTVALSRR